MPSAKWIWGIIILANVLEVRFFIYAFETLKIVRPFRSNSFGDFVSNDLNFPAKDFVEKWNGRHRRSPTPTATENLHNDDQTLYVVIEDSAEKILLQLTPNTRLMTPMTVVEWVYEDGRRVVRKVQDNCLYSGKEVGAKGHSLVAVSNCDGLVGYIQTNNESYFIEPLTKELHRKLRHQNPTTKDHNSKDSTKAKYQQQKQKLLRYEEVHNINGEPNGGSRPHVMYKVESLYEKFNLSIDQEFDKTKKDKSPKKLNVGNSHPNRNKYRPSPSLKPRLKRSSSTLQTNNKNNNNKNNNNSNNLRRKKRCRKILKKLLKLGKDVKQLFAEETCLSKKERKKRRKELREKKKQEREKKRKEREERRKLRRRKKKKKQKTNGNFTEHLSSADPPLNGEVWEGYSPDLLWDTQVAAGQSGLTVEVSDDFGGPPNENDPPKWLELTVGVDYSVIDFHGETLVEKYVFTLFNIVSAIYEDPSLKANLTIVLLRLIFYKDKAQGHVHVGNAKMSLESVNRWGETLHRLSAPHLKHDLAVWLTRLDLGGPSGYAPVSGICDPTRSCTLNRDEGLTSAFIIAHEMGHVLGMSHDGDASADNDCEVEGRLGSVMAPLVAATFGRFHWSKCSRNEYYMTGRLWECLKNEPSSTEAKTFKSTVQYRFSLDDQCRMEFGEGFTLCRTYGIPDPCTFLWCSNSSAPHLCKTKKGPPLEGTICGENKICLQGFCKEIDEDVNASKNNDSPLDERTIPIRHNPQHGGWSTWSSWGPCSLTCGTGAMFRSRECDNPEPLWGGRQCEGKRDEWKLCSTNPCPNEVDLRAEQCKNLPNLFKIGRRKSKLKWLPFESKRRRKKCKVSCLSSQTNEVYVGKENVIDGTKCSYSNPHEICVQGKCVPIGCDDRINSDKKFDACGICGGNGTQCRDITFTFRKVPTTDYIKVASIPKGARRIIVKEGFPTSHFLALRDHSSNLVLNPRHKEGPSYEFVCEGTMFQYINDKEKEYLFAPGPLLAPVSIMIHGGNSRREVSLRVSFIIQNKYKWEVGSFGSCSASCGGGTRQETLICKDLQTYRMTSEDYCHHLPKPLVKNIVCNNFSCDVRWVSDEWEHCTATCGSEGVQFRLVSCVREEDARPIEFNDLTKPEKFTFLESQKNISTVSDEETILLNRGLRVRSHENYYYKGYTYVDPSYCDVQHKPASERPCNRVICPVYWREIGWSKCSVTCGMGKQQRIFACRRENEVDISNNKIYCGESPKEFRACYSGECPANQSCTKDQSVFCQLPSLYRYCEIPKYYEMCCETCERILKYP